MNDINNLINENADTNQTAVTEIERAAITLLYNHKKHGRGLWHPALSAWVESIGTDPVEQRFIDQYVVDEIASGSDTGLDIQAEMIDFGFSIPDDNPFGENFHNVSRDISNGHPGINNNPGREAYARMFPNGGVEPRSVQEDDEMALDLATAIVMYRREARPVGDVTRNIGWQGDPPQPLMTISTSLAAAIGEYQLRLLSKLSRTEAKLEGWGL